MAKKGQSFQRYSEETKQEAVYLLLEEGFYLLLIREHLGIRSDAQMVEWVKKHQKGEGFKDQRGLWNRKHFTSLEEECLFESAGRISKKAPSQSIREGVVLKVVRFEIIDCLRSKQPLKSLFQIVAITNGKTGTSVSS